MNEPRHNIISLICWNKLAGILLFFFGHLIFAFSMFVPLTFFFSRAHSEHQRCEQHVFRLHRINNSQHTSIHSPLTISYAIYMCTNVYTCTPQFWSEFRSRVRVESSRIETHSHCDEPSSNNSEARNQCKQIR